MAFRPLLAPLKSPADTPTFFQDITFPKLISPKVDGIRAIPRLCPIVEHDAALREKIVGHKDVVLSRTLKMFPNKQVQQSYAHELFRDFDGEMAIGEPTAPNLCNRTQSHLSSFDKEGDLRFYVFDLADEVFQHTPYYERLEILKRRVEELHNVQRLIKAAGHVVPHIEVLPQYHCDTLEELLHYEGIFLEEGYEGAMFRCPAGYYKHNRATYKENIIYKLKRFTDVEVTIVDFVEGTKNTNTKEIDERGFAKRSTAKAGIINVGTLGKLICLFNGEAVEVAPGYLTKLQKQAIWDDKEKYRGAVITMRYFGYGMKNKLRFPRFIAFRDGWNM